MQVQEKNHFIASRGFRHFGIIGMVFLLSACQVKKQLGDSIEGACGTESSDTTQKRLEAFVGTLHPVIRGAKCLNCHDGLSGKAPFPHSASNPLIAYRAAVQLADFNNIDNSRFVKKILKNHNCGSNSECQELSRQVSHQIGDWADQESRLPPPPTCAGDLATGLKLVLPAIEIKPSELSKTRDKIKRWDLREINAVVGKVVFSINLRGFTDKTTNGSGTYQMSNPILATETYRLKVIDVVPLINGKRIDAYANYVAVNHVVDAQAFDPTASILGFSPLSDYPQQIAYEKNPESDTLAFVITLQSTTEPPSRATKAPGCKAPNQFKLVYDNVFDLKVNVGGEFVGQCTRCHGDPNAAANAVMNLSGNGVDPCLQALMRTRFDDPIKSLLLTKPSRQDETAAQNREGSHPVEINLLNDASLNAQKSFILDWIRAEANSASGR